MTAPAFGRALRPLWDLDPDGIFLNHGSFGACPKVVIAAQARIRAAMEAQPDVFFRRRVSLRDGPDTELRAAAARLARFVGCGDGTLAFVENATAGVQAALCAVDLAPGDRVLITSHTYNAVRLMVEARCRETGAVPVVAELPLPADAGEIVARFDAAGEGVRVAILDHITSPTAIVMPLERIVPRLKERGALVIVDGAHAVGHIPLDVPATGADWYTSNAHKWLYAPRGSAFLYAAPGVAPRTHPLVTSHYVEQGFPLSFDWVGTRDYSGWLAVPAAIGFHQGIDAEGLSAHVRRLLDLATATLEGLGAVSIAPMALCARMRSFALPQRRPAADDDVRELVGRLWERDRIQSMAVKFGSRLLLRVSGQAYVGEEDVRALGEALGRDGWPGR